MTRLITKQMRDSFKCEGVNLSLGLKPWIGLTLGAKPKKKRILILKGTIK